MFTTGNINYLHSTPKFVVSWEGHNIRLESTKEVNNILDYLSNRDGEKIVLQYDWKQNDYRKVKVVK